ncbi:unnamed protein product [Urochloa decumbens]|uniref:F-box domain-containing protein n=1 Tax=Urochloa decumbens TaxID=240449 RepID=A0ABC9D6V7_9POAL
MPPPVQPLPDDLIPNILVRLSPDDPAGVVRAAAVCKSWRRILADPAFAARYRSLHPSSAPVLGFLHNQSNLHVSRFVPTSSFRPSPAAAHRRRHAHDCRHGRVLFYDYDPRSPTQGFVVWDPIAGGLHSFRESMGSSPIHQAVLCAGGSRCDHRSCAGGPFIVAAVAMGFGADDIFEGKSSMAQADFYSSETGEWGMHIYTDVETAFDLVDRPAALVGDSLYFVGESGILLRYGYELLRRRLLRKKFWIKDYSKYLSVIQPPEGKRLSNVFVVAAEDGGLGLVSLHNSYSNTRLCMWARETAGPVGDAGEWVQRRVIDLKATLPIWNPKRRPCLCGVAEDGSAIFVSTEYGVFAIGLGSSSKARKVSGVGNVNLMYPFMSFYTESLLLKLASGKNAAPVGDH